MLKSQLNTCQDLRATGQPSPVIKNFSIKKRSSKLVSRKVKPVFNSLMKVSSVKFIKNSLKTEPFEQPAFKNSRKLQVATQYTDEGRAKSPFTKMMDQGFFQNRDVQSIRREYSRYHYIRGEVAGKGTFGTVFVASVKETGEKVAIKRVFLDPNYKNRQLQLSMQMNHPNVVFLLHHFSSTSEKPKEEYINLVMRLMPQTLYSVNKKYQSSKSNMPAALLKVFAFQLFRSLAYIHARQVCHRDIKPHNVLVDPVNNLLQLCDFGSAKKLVMGQKNISYICSRCYRAPELIFNASDYTTAIDLWAAGCVLAEMANGTPLFLGNSNVEQLLEFFKVLGSPSKLDLLKMNPEFDSSEYKLPELKPRDWRKVLRKTDSQLVDLVSRLLVYDPGARLTARQALQHQFFDELRTEEGLKSLGREVALPVQLMKQRGRLMNQ